MATSLAYITKVNPSRSDATYTANSVSIGTADTNRRVIVAYAGGGIRNLSSATIGGVSATVHGTHASANGVAAFFSAIVPTGTTSDIVATVSSTDFFDNYFIVWTIDDTEIDINSIVFTANDISSATSTGLAYTATTGGVSLAAVGFQNGNNAKCPITIDNSFIRDYEDDFDGSLMGASLDGETSGARTTTISWSGSYSGEAALIMIPLNIYPTVVQRGSARTSATNTTSHAITIPTHAVGDMILVHFAVDGNPTVTDGSGTWQKLGQDSNATVVTGAIFWKIATTTSETLTLTTSNLQQSSHTVYIIRPDIGKTLTIEGASANGSSVNAFANPPSLTPSGGTQPYLWIVTRAGDSFVSVPSFAPVGFSELQTLKGDGGQSASTSTAERKYTDSTLNPSTFSEAADEWVSWTLAVWQIDSEQSLTPSLFTNGQTFYSATVSFSYSLSAPLYTNTNVFYDATVSASYDLEPSLYTNNNTFYSATVSVGEVTLSPSLYTNTNEFYNANVTTSYDLTPALYTNEQVFYNPSVSVGAVTLTPDLYTNGQTFYSATVSQGASPQTLEPELFTNNQTFYSATVTTSYELTPSLYTNNQTIYNATVSAIYTLAPSLFNNAQQFFSATVTVGGVTLSPDLFTNTQTFYSPVVNLEGAPQIIAPDLFANEKTFYSAVVSTGAVSVEPELFTNTQVFYSASISATYELTPSLYNNSQTFYSPTVTSVKTLQPALFVNTSVFYSATVITDQFLTPALFTNTSVFYSPSITGDYINNAPRSGAKRLSSSSRSNLSTGIRGRNISTLRR